MSSARENNRRQAQHDQIFIHGQTAATRRHGLARSADVLPPRLQIPQLSPRPDPLALTAETNAVEQVMNINRHLLSQIETLRLKVEIDSRHQEANKAEVKAIADTEVKARESRLYELKADLKDKDEFLQNLTERNHQRTSAIRRLEEEIRELKEDVLDSKGYADQIQKQLEELQATAASLERGTAYREKDNHIRQLRDEVNKLHVNLETMEKELALAKDKIAQQGTQLRLVDVDRLNTQIKYKQELAKVTHTMQEDNARIREVMCQQWKEMRNLREQNESMRDDIREIRNLIMSNPHLPQRAPGPTNQTRFHGHMSSHLDFRPPSPALPCLSPKDTRRAYGSGRKKP